MAVEKVLCIMSYYEYFELFCTALNLVASILRFQRLTRTNDGCCDAAALSISSRLFKEIEAAQRLPVIPVKSIR